MPDYPSVNADPAATAETPQVVLARIITPHDRTMELDYHEWITLGERLALDRLARRNGSVSIENATVWRCNNPDCPGVAWVADAGIVTLIEEAENG